MFMRYHWGLGVGHIYSHVWDSTTDEVKTMAGTPEAYLGRFDDLENELTICELNALEWLLLGTDEAGTGVCSTENISDFDADTDRAHFKLSSDCFEDLDADFSLDALEWEMAADGDDLNEDGARSDGGSDSDTSVMYTMYGLDWAYSDESD